MPEAVQPQIIAAPRTRSGGRLLGIALGVAVVALSARIAVPVPFSPVPMTLQPLAVLVVGGLLGAAGGAAALAIYLLLGLAGLPVFAGGAGPLYLMGPTGGYLLAFPVAAAVAGRIAGRGRTPALTAGRALLAALAGMVVIHVGGLAQLTVLSHNAAQAFRLGFVPFFTGDLVKVGLAAVAILLFRPAARRLR
ncbi:MAG TPA: biotin transporter BioY [Gemmatimonadales bacterium]|jgi:biotin transport system substrate-specific component|nr:biotin transporter BioY [Gemmatimonadales bacterium]